MPAIKCSRNLNQKSITISLLHPPCARREASTCCRSRTLSKVVARRRSHGTAFQRIDFQFDRQAMVIEEADRQLEAEMLAAISSTFQGVGAASARKIMGRGNKAAPIVRSAKDVPELKPFIRDGHQYLKMPLCIATGFSWEGTQGTTLSLHHGMYPFVTSRDTTVAGCLADAGIAADQSSAGDNGLQNLSDLGRRSVRPNVNGNWI